MTKLKLTITSNIIFYKYYSATPFSWAQRRDRLFISINLRDLKDEKIDLQPNSLSFDCESDGKKYTGVVNFYEEIDVEVIILSLSRKQ